MLDLTNKPASDDRAGLVKSNSKQSNYILKNYKFKFNRSLLPSPASYYSKEFPGLKIKSEWVKVSCPFHDDTTPSLNISMVGGHFRCFACGAKGGDILSFHRQRYKVGFTEAVTYLGAWE